jgi:hypothetical protein
MITKELRTNKQQNDTAIYEAIIGELRTAQQQNYKITSKQSY